MSYYTKTFAILIFIYSLCFYLYILQCNGGFDLHMYIPLYLFSVHLLSRYVSAAWPKKSGRLKTQLSLIYTAISH